MKSLRKLLVVLIVSAVPAGLILSAGGCTDTPPLAPAKTASGEGGLQFVSLGKGSASLKKVVQVTEWVSHRDGGQLTLQYIAQRNGNPIQVVVTLNVLPHTISQDAQLTLSLDDEALVGNVDLSFAPHGITFSQPALLSIQAKGLDLSMVDPEKIDIYYDNPESGQWEQMERKRVVVKQSQGVIHVVLAEIPHFSRYAVAWSR